MVKTGSRATVRKFEHHNTEVVTKDTACKNTDMMPEFQANKDMYVEATPVKNGKKVDKGSK